MEPSLGPKQKTGRGNQARRKQPGKKRGALRRGGCVRSFLGRKLGRGLFEAGGLEDGVEAESARASAARSARDLPHEP